MLPSSLLLEKNRVVGHVSGEGLAPIVSAYSRLILVDGTVPIVNLIFSELHNA